MATVNANTVAIYVDVAAGTVVNPAEDTGGSPSMLPVLFSTSASISVSNATYEATSITNSGTGATSRDFAVGSTSTSITVEGIASWDTLSDTLDLDAIFDEVIGKDKVAVVWASTDTAGTAYGGKGFFTSFELNAGVDDFATFSASIELDGDPVSVA